MARARALTLLELLIVVAILAILTTVATRSLVSVGEQTQFENNDALAKDFRRALVGNPGSIQSDGTPSVTGFIADLGRPPRAELEAFVVGENEAVPSMTGNALTLRELVVPRTGPPFAIYRPDINTVTRTNLNPGVYNILLFDSTNTIPAGWRGPYLQGGADSIVDDSWGKPLAAYSEAGERSLVDFWCTSYLDTINSPPVLSPYTGVSLNGYHSAGTTAYGSFPVDVIGLVFRPGPASVVAAGSSLSLAAYSNAFSAGVVFTNEYVSQLSCTIGFNTNAIPDPNFTSEILTNYWYLAGVIMYAPNPHYHATAAAATPTLANSRPIGVGYLASGTAILGTGIAGGNSVNFPSPTSLVFTNFPCVFTSGGGPTYPLVNGAKVVKPFLLAKRKNGVSPLVATTDVAFFPGAARNLTLRPGFNSVQLSIP